jgi:hypothetical protein
LLSGFVKVRHFGFLAIGNRSVRHSRGPLNAPPLTKAPTGLLTDDQKRAVERRCLEAALVKHARYYWLLLAESGLTRRLFGAMIRTLRSDAWTAAPKAA